jgi:glycosyltransferase involved in cell wall biosynthesis
VRDRRALGWNPETFVIAWAGSGEYAWHDLKGVMKAAELAANERPTWRFALFCNPSHLPPLPANVSHADEVSYWSMPNYLASADVGLCLYRGTRWSKWGNYFSPLKLYDYLACGLPAVVSDEGQAAEIVRRHDCGLVINDSGEALVDALSRLEVAAGDRVRMGHNGRRAVEEFYNWDRVADQTLEILKTVLSR